MITKQVWDEAQEWERKWHDDCINSFNEERKQLAYAESMGLPLTPTAKTPFNIDLQGKSVLDIGGGAYSLLLKCSNKGNAVVADPLMYSFPAWVRNRYQYAHINAIRVSGEDVLEEKSNLGKLPFDEVWFYNVLQHTYNPLEICSNALKLGKIVRVFEWINTSKNIGHPQILTQNKLDSWLRGEGRVAHINKNGAVGQAYFGVFKGDKYERG